MIKLNKKIAINGTKFNRVTQEARVKLYRRVDGDGDDSYVVFVAKVISLIGIDGKAIVLKEIFPDGEGICCSYFPTLEDAARWYASTVNSISTYY